MVGESARDECAGSHPALEITLRQQLIESSQDGNARDVERSGESAGRRYALTCGQAALHDRLAVRIADLLIQGLGSRSLDGDGRQNARGDELMTSIVSGHIELFTSGYCRQPLAILCCHRPPGGLHEDDSYSMHALEHLRSCALLCSAVVGSLPPGTRTAAVRSERARTRPAKRDGQHDFDFEIGTWKTHLKRLVHPLSGTNTWVEYDGITVVRKVWDGRANLVELDVGGPAGRIEALSLRLYNPHSHQWSLNFSNSKGGTVSPPTIGEFKNGRGWYGFHALSVPGCSLRSRRRRSHLPRLAATA